MEVIHGKNLIIRLNGTAIAGARSCEISIDDDVIETSSSSTGTWRTFIAGRKEWSASCALLLPATGTPLKSEADMVGRTVSITFQSGMRNDTLTGTAIIKQWKATGTLGNLAQGSFAFRGTGPLS